MKNVNNEFDPNAFITVQQSKTTNRKDMNLPGLSFLFIDDWTPKLGMLAAHKWLELYTMGDRSSEQLLKGKVPRSMTKLAKYWGIGTTKLYEQIIAPLWNYGLIELVEHQDDNKPANATKPINIIVNHSPWNDKDNIRKPLEKKRDYATQWQSKARIHNMNRKKKEYTPIPLQETGGFPLQEGGVSHDGKGGFPITGNNNITKPLINSTKPINNNYIKSSSKEEIDKELIEQYSPEIIQAAKELLESKDLNTTTTNQYKKCLMLMIEDVTKPKRSYTKQTTKIEKVPEWFNDREKRKTPEQPEYSKEELEAMRQKLLEDFGKLGRA